MHIVDLRADDEAAIGQVATLLVEDFATAFPGSWPDLESALEEVRASFAAGRISRVARMRMGRCWAGSVESASIKATCGNCIPWWCALAIAARASGEPWWLTWKSV
jgi:hypothetical protein